MPSLLKVLFLCVIGFFRFFSKQSKAADLNKSAEENTPTCEMLKDISTTLNTISQPCQIPAGQLASIPEKQSSSNIDTGSLKSSPEQSGDQASLVSPRKQNCSMSSVRNLFKSDSKTSSDSVKPHSWSQKFTFQKSKSLKSSLENSNTPSKEFKLPPKKMEYFPSLKGRSSEHLDESSVSQMETDTLNNTLTESNTDNLMDDKCVGETSESLLEDEDEEMVDDPSPPDSGISITSSPIDKSSLSYSEVSVNNKNNYGHNPYQILPTPFNSCWNVCVLHNLPSNTNHITCCHLDLVYQFILSVSNTIYHLLEYMASRFKDP